MIIKSLSRKIRIEKHYERQEKHLLDRYKNGEWITTFAWALTRIDDYTKVFWEDYQYRIVGTERIELPQKGLIGVTSPPIHRVLPVFEYRIIAKSEKSGEVIR